MADSKFTSGPWKWTDDDYSQRRLSGPDELSDEILVIRTCGACEARRDANCGGPHNTADAALIAAAPDLLAALKALTDAAEFDFCGESTDDCSDDETVAMDDGSAFTFGMIRRARAAIDKAEGR